MTNDRHKQLSRREALRTLLATPATLALTALPGTIAQAQSAGKAPWQAPALLTQSAAAQPAALQTANLSPTLQKLYNQALAEGGKLVIYVGGDEYNQFDATKQSFEAQFPGIEITARVNLSKYHDIQIDRQLALGQLEPDLAQLQTLHDFDYWKRKGYLLNYKPEGFNKVYPQYKDRDGAYVGLFVLAFTNVVNIQQVAESEAPRDASDYLDPKFKGKIICTYPNDDDGVLYAFELIVAKYGWGYMDRFMAQEPEFVRGVPTSSVAVTAGRKVATPAAVGTLAVFPNSPTRFLLPRTDRFVSWAQTAAIFKHARHPAAAKLYMSWRLLPEVQRQWIQWPVRMDVPAPGGYQAITKYNTSLDGFHKFMLDRDRVDRFKALIETWVGPVKGISPLDD